jgi:hypothetical protein
MDGGNEQVSCDETVFIGSYPFSLIERIVFLNLVIVMHGVIVKVTSLKQQR